MNLCTVSVSFLSVWNYIKIKNYNVHFIQLLGMYTTIKIVYAATRNKNLIRQGYAYRNNIKYNEHNTKLYTNITVW